MNVKLWRLNQSGMLGCVYAVVVFAFLFVGYTPEAFGFFPFGYSEDVSGDIEFPKWSYNIMDSEGGSDISGPDDGVPITFETGDNGFTDEEIEIIKDAFDVWASVPTSYLKFTFVAEMSSPAEVDPAAIDGFHFVAMQTAGDTQIASLTANDVALAVFTYSVADGYAQTPDGTSYPVTGGQFLDADLIFDENMVRSAIPGQDPTADLFGAAVHEIGHMVGLDHNPMNNLELINGQYVESPVLAMRNPQTNDLKLSGVTPSMFPILSYVSTNSGLLEDAAKDLSPDDIAGISFLYPRGSQDEFFKINHEIRSHVHQYVPSVPILGAFITAYCDVNGGMGERPSFVPLISTISGLYEHPSDSHMRGFFSLKNLPKDIETISSDIYPATYVITSEPVVGDASSWLTKSGLTIDDIDSTHDTTGGGLTWSQAYDSLFPAEVFHEDTTLFDIENVNSGTRLVYDKQRRHVISADSEKSIDTILPGNKPMFGDRNDVCPFNMVAGSLGSSNLNKIVRGFRDKVLLQSAIGIAIADAFYQAAPSMVSFLITHDSIFAMARVCAGVAEWCITNRIVTICFLLAILVIVYALRSKAKFVTARRNNRGLSRFIPVLLFAFLCLGAGSTQACQVYMTEEELANNAQNIIAGTVVSVEERITPDNRRIYTDVVIENNNSAIKGNVNKNSNITLTIIGGRIGVLVTKASNVPSFKAGEEIVLYYQYQEGYGNEIVGGKRGKVTCIPDSETGVSYVYVPINSEGKKSATGVSEKYHKMTRDEYVDYLRAVVKEQAKRK